MTNSRVPRKTPYLLAVTALLSAVALAGCSGGSDDGSAPDSGDADFAAGGSAGEAPADAPQAASDEDSDSASAFDGGSGTTQQAALEPGLGDVALVRTGEIELRSDDIGDTLSRLKAYVFAAGGRIDSEETATDDDGEEVRSQLSVKVPVARFDEAYERISVLADLVSQRSSTEDVTAKLADVESRVESAKDSITQLRVLFSRANKLGEIIALERELSGREANLEALQAQQRALHAKTSMSTIRVSITQPPPKLTETPEKKKDQAGFVAGIKDGWDGMVTFVVGASHGLGLVLPLGALFAAISLAGWTVFRRFTPRRDVQPQLSE